MNLAPPCLYAIDFLRKTAGFSYAVLDGAEEMGPVIYIAWNCRLPKVEGVILTNHNGTEIYGTKVKFLEDIKSKSKRLDKKEDQEELKLQLLQAKSHFKQAIGRLTPNELECLGMDKLIDYGDIPEEKRTDHVKSMLR